MRVYDIALAMVRLFAAVDLTFAIIQTPVSTLKLALLLETGMTPLDGFREIIVIVQTPIDNLLVGLVLLATSRPIARFAAKFASTTDTATAF